MREPEHMGNVSCGEPSLNEYSAAPTDGGDDDDDDDDDGENWKWQNDDNVLGTVHERVKRRRTGRRRRHQSRAASDTRRRHHVTSLGARHAHRK